MLSSEVFETNNLSTIKVKFDLGVDNNGKQIIKNRSFNNVDPTSTSLDVYNVCEKLASLQKHTLAEVIKQDNTLLNV